LQNQIQDSSMKLIYTQVVHKKTGTEAKTMQYFLFVFLLPLQLYFLQPCKKHAHYQRCNKFGVKPVISNLRAALISWVFGAKDAAQRCDVICLMIRRS